ncbi:MAG TPA: amidohydrolase family protein [Flavobacterium sp.]|nr:amidohydrolase family protein [Flavobacterium sp.]
MKNKNFLISLSIIISLLISETKCFSQESNQIVLKNVNIITMTMSNEIIPNATVVIKDHRIESINESIPESAQIIDAKDKWLIPGLIDVHVHLPNDFNLKDKLPTEPTDIRFDVQDLMTPFIANGVTTILNLNANVESFYQRKIIQNRDVIGPRMALAVLIDGGNGNGRFANTALEGRQAVRMAKADGYEFIKLYSNLNIETYNAIIDEANIQDMKTVGHIPNVFQNNIEKAFIPHFNLVAHAEEFSKSAKDYNYAEALKFAKIAKENGTWVSPTLTAMVWIASQTNSLNNLKASQTIQYTHPLLQSKWLTANSYNKNTSPEQITYFNNLVSFQSLLVQAFKEVGVPIITGTDTGVSGVVSGFSLHDELELLVASGLTTEEALSSSTRLSALWLGLESKIGTIEVGKFADLILLDENPLENINNTRKIAGVFVNGQWLDKKEIDKILSNLSKKNTVSKNEFDWNKTMKKQ